ncbi:DUF2063 domain-containing protein [Duganella sp. BJB488]|uniref:HvfC/BufC N-terminal domain-containing protein n=1 Tax=unclassified Duganella TaxID=2636909 RepID=UPI000E34FCCA|nr:MULTISPECIES: DNA-binding domain-containing protein [unclassified Duganella]RFP09084.1 DUF2063 domain-containing protein [Duganella sp. BJB489]RFP12515.1 DUF2063 domain-containing protein [Duganella sp. BJB488]RFP29084.1 DUF2063 domain-containing protein [Duganella sp. BJB480]
MNTLDQVQSAFQRYILADDAPGAIHAAVREQYGLSATSRLAIYHSAYRSRLRQALCEAYDKTWTYIGDDMFAELANSYIAEHPSRHANLRWFGGGLAAHAAVALADYPFIAELAELEWSLSLAFDAQDTAPLAAADLADIPPEAWSELRFGLHPSVHLLDMHWNAVALWQALAAGAEPPEPEQSNGATHWLVWRQGEQPHFRSLPVVEADALYRIAEGATFGEVCAAAGEEAMLALAGYLQHWLAQGLLLKR